MPGILSEITTEVYNSNDYVMKVWDSITDELTNRTVSQQHLKSRRTKEMENAIEIAQQTNAKYVQLINAAWGDLIHTASTVPAVIEQTDETIKNDDNLQKTLSGDLVRTAVDGKIDLAKEELPIAAEKQRMADKCSSEGSDPILISNVIKNNSNATCAGLVGTFRSGLNRLKPNDASIMASTDCTKEVATAMVKDAGRDFASEVVSLAALGMLTPSFLAVEFDEMMGKVGTGLANYLGGVLGGLPNGNICASQTLTNLSAKAAMVANFADLGFKMATVGAKYANNMINMASSLVAMGPELLVNAAETLAQTAVNTAFMAVRIGAKQNCAIRLALDAADGVLGLADVTMKGGTALINSAQEVKSSIDTLIHTVKTVDIKERTLGLLKNHPAVLSIDNLLKSSVVDIRTYMHLTETGIKYARISLGADQQNKITSMQFLHNKAIKDTWARGYIKRRNYTTDMYVNRYNVYGMFSYKYQY